MFAAFTPEQEDLRRNVRESLAQVCPAGVVRAAWTDREAARHAWQGIVDLGLLGVMVRAESGGLGLDARDAVTLCEECGYSGLPGPFIDTAWVAAPALDLAGGDAAPILAGVLAGTARVAARSPTSPFVADGDLAHWVLLLDGEHADLHDRNSLDWVSEEGVDSARRPFRVHPRPAGSLAGGAAAATVGVPLALAGGEDAFDRGALASAAFQLGLGRRMLDIALGYVKVREQFGRAVGSYQAVQHHLANAAVALTFAAPLVWRAAHSLAIGHAETSTHISMAHLRASAAAENAGRASLQVHGAIGYTTEHDLHLFLKRAWSMQRAWGDATFHRSRIGAALERRSDTKEYWDV